MIYKILFLVSLSCQILHAQNDALLLKQQIPFQADLMEIDNIGQLYLCQEGLLEMYNSEGELLHAFDANDLGAIHQLDVQQPMQILVYYDAFNTLILLDRKLTEVARFDLSDLDIWQPTAVALSADQQLWVYHPLQFRFLKVDAWGNLLQEGPDLNLFLELELTPNLLVEYQQQLFLNDPQEGIFVFDLFGNFIKKLPIGQVERFQIYRQQLFFMRDQQLFTYNLRTLEQKQFPSPKKNENLLDIKIQDNFLFTRSLNNIFIFKATNR